MVHAGPHGMSSSSELSIWKTFTTVMRDCSSFWKAVTYLGKALQWDSGG